MSHILYPYDLYVMFLLIVLISPVALATFRNQRPNAFAWRTFVLGVVLFFAWVFVPIIVLIKQVYFG